MSHSCFQPYPVLIQSGTTPLVVLNFICQLMSYQTPYLQRSPKHRLVDDARAAGRSAAVLHFQCRARAVGAADVR